MTHKRVLRVAETIRRELSVILDRKLEDPRIVMTTVTRVELSRDLKYAKIYISLLGDADEQTTSLKLLRKAVKFIRGELAYSLNLRAVPELTFVLDDSAENYIRIATVLKEIHNEAVDVHDETVDVHDETVGVHDETVDVHDEAVDVHDETVDVHDETVDVHDETVDEDCEDTDAQQEQSDDLGEDGETMGEGEELNGGEEEGRDGAD